jgi:hypothetical protein
MSQQQGAPQQRDAEQQPRKPGQQQTPDPQRDLEHHDPQPHRQEKQRETGQEQNRPKRDKAPPDRSDEPKPYSEP